MAELAVVSQNDATAGRSDHRLLNLRLFPAACREALVEIDPRARDVGGVGVQLADHQRRERRGERSLHTAQRTARDHHANARMLGKDQCNIEGIGNNCYVIQRLGQGTSEGERGAAGIDHDRFTVAHQGRGKLGDPLLLLGESLACKMQRSLETGCPNRQRASANASQHLLPLELFQIVADGDDGDPETV